MIEIKLENLPRLRQAFDPARVDKAFNSALRKTAGKARTRVSQEVRKIYNIKARDISQSVKTINRQDFIELRWTGKTLGLDKYSPTKRTVRTARGPRKGVAVKVLKKGKRKLVKGGFQVASKNNLIFQRTGQKMASNPQKDAIARMFGLSVPQMVNKKVTNNAIEFIGDEMNVQFERAFNFFLNVQK